MVHNLSDEAKLQAKHAAQLANSSVTTKDKTRDEFIAERIASSNHSYVTGKADAEDHVVVIHRPTDQRLPHIIKAAQEIAHDKKYEQYEQEEAKAAKAKDSIKVDQLEGEKKAYVTKLASAKGISSKEVDNVRDALDDSHKKMQEQADAHVGQAVAAGSRSVGGAGIPRS